MAPGVPVPGDGVLGPQRAPVGRGVGAVRPHLPQPPCAGAAAELHLAAACDLHCLLQLVAVCWAVHACFARGSGVAAGWRSAFSSHHHVQLLLTPLASSYATETKHFWLQITALDFTPDGKVLAVGSEDGVVAAWDVAGARRLGSSQQHAGPVWALAASRGDGSLLASGAPSPQAAF